MKILSKYPVIKNGVDYRVDIEKLTDIFRGISQRCTLYLPRESRFKWRKWKRIYTEGYEWDHDFIGTAIFAIEQYEEKLAKEAKRLREYEDGLRQFNEWDGIVSDEGEVI